MPIANSLRTNNGLEIYAIGIGPQVDMGQLTTLANGQANVIWAQSTTPQDFNSILAFVLQKNCVTTGLQNE